MGVLDRIPEWATTGVGSLPHDDPGRAVEHVTAAYDVPFCPQLPCLDGDMIVEWLGDDPRRCGWSPQRDREQPAAWGALLTALDREAPPHRVVKLQVTGPATLACALERASGGAPSRRASAALAGELATWLAANAGHQIQALAARGLDALLVVDEPALHLFGAAGLETVWDPLRTVAPTWGLHLCGPVPWDLVERAEPDVVSFDLGLAGVTSDGAVALRGVLARGGRIAWGALAAHRAEPASVATTRLQAAAAVGAGGEHSLLTPSCGTARMSERREADVARALRDIARTMAAPARGDFVGGPRHHGS